MRTLFIAVFVCLSFTIFSQTITVTSPSGGDTLVGGQTYSISWTNTGSISMVDLYYLRNGVQYTIQTNVVNTGSFSWTVPGGILSSNNGYVKVRNSGSIQNDQNDMPFRFQQAPKSLTMTYPNALTDTLQSGSANTITWSSAGSVSQVRLLYSLNGGASYSYIIFGTSNTGAYTWTPPNYLNSSQLRIKVVDKFDVSIEDAGDTSSVLKIGTTLTLNQPVPKNLIIGNSESLQWTTTGIVSHVDIAYSKDFGAWISIADSIANSGAFNWTVPNDSSNSVRIKLEDAADPSIRQVVYGFSMSSTPQTLMITAPNGGQVLTEGSPYKITWNSSTSLAGMQVLVDYSLDSGATWSNSGDGPVDSNYYDWILPLHLSSNLCLVKVYVIGLPGIADTSDNVFSIVLGPNAVVVDEPNGGEKYLADAFANLRYHTTGTVDSLNYYYSTDGGVVWIPMVGKVSSQKSHVSITWPDVHSANCLVKFEDYTDTSLKDSSDAIFTISKFRLTRPYPNTTVYQGGTTNFTWGKSSSTSDTVSFFYSVDAGLNWTLISDSIPNTGFYVWTVPQDSSNTCKIKVVDRNNVLISDEIGEFKIHPSPFKLITPNGGEYWSSAAPDTIRWNNFGNVYRINLEYTLDGGLNWTSIGNYIFNTGLYAWTTPNIASSAVQIRISDYFNNGVQDVSDTTFNIGVNPPNTLTLVNPNGGGVFGVGSSQNISWTSSGMVSAVDIYFSTNNGATWTTVALNEPNDSSYSWTVPNVNSNQCLIKISESGDASVADSSNAVFSIGSAITIISPNGGEGLNAGNSFVITWATTGVVGNIDLSFSIDSGLTWTSMATSLSGSSYSWAIPNISSNQCLVRAEDGAINDESDQVFTINPILGNQVLLAKYYFDEGSVHDDFGSIDGARYNMFTTTDRFSCANHAMYNNSTNAGYIALGDTFDNVVAATDSSFSVSMWVSRYTTSSAGVLFGKNSDGNCGEAGRQMSMSMTSSGKIQFVSHYSLGFGNYDISQSSGTVSTTGWHHIVLNYDGGINTSGTARVEVYIDNILQTMTSTGSGGTLGDIQDGPASFSFGNQAKSDSTACGNFYYEGGIDDVNIYAGLLGVTDVNTLFLETKTCPSESLTLSTPATGALASGGINTVVNWSTIGTVPNVDLYYSIDGGFSFNLIAANQPNTGSYNWMVPNVNSMECLIRIEDASNAAVLDESNGYFQIEIQTIDIIIPNSGQTYNGLDTEFVRWNSNGVINAVDIYFSSDSGTTWSTMATDVPNNIGPTYTTYYYPVPNINSNKCLIRVVDTGNANIADTSDIPFIINFTADSLRILNPNGSNYLTGGNNINITWFKQGIVDTVNLYYSIDSGATYSLIANHEPNDGHYVWSIPSVTSTHCLVKIEDVVNAGTSDVSDAVFTIGVPHQLNVSYPNGGELIEAYAQDSIAWTSNGLFSLVDIYVSTNGGSGWQLVDDSIANTGKYIWNTPAVNSLNCLVRIEETGTSAIVDTSTSIFEIGAVAMVQLLYPNGGETLVGGTVDSVLWKGNGNVFAHNVQFSSDSGVTWTWIGDDPLQNERMNWGVPNINSSLCLIILAGDTSDATFTINKSNVSLPMEQELHSFKAYPNPTKGKVQVEEEGSVRSVTVYDVWGKLIFKTEDSNSLDLSATKKGVYLLKIETIKGKMFFRKIIKQN